MKRYSIILIVATFSSCEQFIQLDAPTTQIVTEKVFENDAGAKAAVAGIYSQLMQGAAFASGGATGITTIAGLSADELQNHSSTADRIAIYTNSLTPVNSVSSLWTEMYFTIYQANAILEGIEGSSGVTKAVKDQVTGEALFMRAFTHFYLANIYGDVPVLTSTDYRVNSVASRAPVTDVYKQIEKDLTEAMGLLLSDYSFSNGEKVRPNRWVAVALLARVYLYQEKWAEAEELAASIIESGLFSLPTDLNSVFLANSDEAIWQLMPVLPRLNTFDGPYFYGEYGIVDVSVSDALLNSFEAGDNRSPSWIATATAGDLTYNYAYKYKIVFADLPLTEYQMVFRLAEQYLIRAEARGMQNDIPGAIDDVNAIRTRAGLEPIDGTGLSQQEALDAISKERRSELFIEWGHRWFDLKRSGNIDAVLGAVKADWQSTDALFPIPQSEINANHNLVQNP